MAMGLPVLVSNYSGPPPPLLLFPLPRVLWEPEPPPLLLFPLPRVLREPEPPPLPTGPAAFLGGPDSAHAYPIATDARGEPDASHLVALCAPCRAAAALRPAPRTDRTRLVPPPVLIGHASSHPPY